MLSNIVKGDYIELEITIPDIDITDWKIRCEIYDDSGNSIKLATANSGGSDDEIEVTLAAASGSRFLIKVANALTTNFDDESKIEIEREDADGKILTIYQDLINFEKEKITWTSPS